MLGLNKIARKVFGSSNDRYIKSLAPRVNAINALSDEMAALSDEDLKNKTTEFRARLNDGAKLDDLLVEAFAVVREGATRALGLRHYDVQLIGGIVLHEGKIAEMKTGEGKTLVATLAAYLNALPGNGVHVVTVNDYLASRDSQWMGEVYNFLGLSVGCIVPNMDHEARQAAYGADITYATNNELGFDYLRDNMKFKPEAMVQRPYAFAIVDEVDSILVDEARTPLIISGPTEDKSELYVAVDKIIPKLVEEDYDLDEKGNNISLTEVGMEHLEQILIEADLIQGDNMYDYGNVAVVHHANQALRAHKMFQVEKDYIVRNGQVVIIDEFTGRMMEGRRYSDGLHQALEAKEGVEIQSENQTLASVTFQNYFRLYPKLSGMTGTAATEAEELGAIYGLEVIEMPTHVPVARVDEDDEVYRTAPEKYNAILDLIEDCHKRGQPILVGTVSIEKSEYLGEMLEKRKVPHYVLNAKFHEQEAYIVGQAGRSGAVTIATNMAGRGTDIKLGGNLEMRIEQEIDSDEKLSADPKKRQKAIEKIEAEIETDKQKVLEAGGLFVLGTERHESRRIDNQLRGRSGRQGDPGYSKFFLSMEDDLMRIFGGERMDGLMQKFGLEEGEAIVHPWINRAIEKAQEKVEARNYDIRKNLLKYDDVMNDQRKVIYDQRRDVMAANDLSETITDMRHEVVEDIVAEHIPPRSYPEEWNTEDMSDRLVGLFGDDFAVKDWAQEEGIDADTVEDRLIDATDKFMAKRAADMGSDMMRALERHVLLISIDGHWKEHLSQLDHLRQGINLRAYGQRDPLNEYKTEAFAMFEYMLAETRKDVTSLMSHGQVQAVPEMSEIHQPDLEELQTSHADPLTGENDDIDLNDPATWVGKVSRNAPCPCGSGKKYKYCHGKISAQSPAMPAPQLGPGGYPKVGRNDPCPCGSGKKYKHCHGKI